MTRRSSLLGDVTFKAHARIVNDPQIILQTGSTGQNEIEQVVSSEVASPFLAEIPHDHDHDCRSLPRANVKRQQTQQEAKPFKCIIERFTLMPECCASRAEPVCCQIAEQN